MSDIEVINLSTFFNDPDKRRAIEEQRNVQKYGAGNKIKIEIKKVGYQTPLKEKKEKMPYMGVRPCKEIYKDVLPKEDLFSFAARKPVKKPVEKPVEIKKEKVKKEPKPRVKKTVYKSQLAPLKYRQKLGVR
jgi:hypothetical protein